MASRRRVDDSGEEEATAIDLRQSKSSVKSSSAQAAAPPKKPAPPAPAKKTATIVDDEEDEDATEFLSVRPKPGQALPASTPSTTPPRSSSSSSSGAPEPQLRARGRAVPLASPEEPAAEPPAPPPPTQRPSQRPHRESTEPLLDVDSLQAGGKRQQQQQPPPEDLNNIPRLPRPLPGVTNTNAPARHPTIDEQSTTGSHTGTSSVPRITRIHVVDSSDSTGPHAPDPDTTLPPSGPDSKRAAAAAQQVARDLEKKRPKIATTVQNLDDETQAPDHADSTQAAPAASPSSTGEIKNPRPVPSTADGEEEDVAHDGVLVVEAPNDAVVVVNGVDRGKGVVRVADLDRKAKHAVRIHAPGFQPWSGSVTLEGKPAAKIRPTLKPRAR